MPSPIFEYVDGAFVQIPGALWNVRAGSRNGVWGLNGANEIYYLDRNDHTAGALGSFNQVGGALTQISVGTDDSVFGLNAAGMIYTFDRTDFRGSKYGSFHQIPGALVSISAYSQDSVFGINAQNDIFKLVTSDTSASPYGSFQKVDRTLLRQKPFQVIAGPDGSCVGRFYRDRIDDDCVFRIPTGEMQAFSMSSSRIDAIARGGPGELYGGGIGGDLNLHRFDGIT